MRSSQWLVKRIFLLKNIHGKHSEIKHSTHISCTMLNILQTLSKCLEKEMHFNESVLNMICYTTKSDYTPSSKDGRLHNSPSFRVRSNYYRDTRCVADKRKTRALFSEIALHKIPVARRCKLLFQYLTRLSKRFKFCDFHGDAPFSKSHSKEIIHIRYSCVRYKIPIVISL